MSELPADLSWSHIFGVGLLAGIGFTMSLFVTNLAFDDPDLVARAKIGIFAGSIISGVAGYFYLKSVLKKDGSEITPAP